MRNLDGSRNCDAIIEWELQTAGVTPVQLSRPIAGDVSTYVLGVLRKNGKDVFTFKRYTTHWDVNGNVPLDVAKILYYQSGEIDRHTIRAAGRHRSSPPELWAFPPLARMRELGLITRYNSEERVRVLNGPRFKNEPRFVDTYHIDTQEGLARFVQVVRQKGLVD